jgi:epoxyqueuosine reductase
VTPSPPNESLADTEAGELVGRIRGWAAELGFQQVGIADCNLGEAEARLKEWLSRGWQGDMDYLSAHGTRRSRPAELVPGTLRVITVRMNYFPAEAADSWDVMRDGSRAYVARYAVGRDYHKVLRGRLQKLCDRISEEMQRADSLPTESAGLGSPAGVAWGGVESLACVGTVTVPSLARVPANGRTANESRSRGQHAPASSVPMVDSQSPAATRRFHYRVFTDSAPVMEVELATKSGLGWRGKHTLVLNREAGSWFFLGEIYTDLPLPVDAPQSDHCGTCSRCMDVCPTQAIVAPYQLDARRCISYLTIEHKGDIPEELRPLMGNRIYGCDDCQLVCPWNRFAQKADAPDFAVRHGLDAAGLVELFSWSEEEFDGRMEGSAIRRIGHERWLRNLAVGLGNAPTSAAVVEALEARRDHPSVMVRNHVQWALKRHNRPAPPPPSTSPQH